MEQEEDENEFYFVKEPIMKQMRENQAVSSPGRRGILCDLNQQQMTGPKNENPASAQHAWACHNAVEKVGSDLSVDCFHVPLQFCDDDDEVFFGPISEKERRRAKKFASRKTIVFDPGFRHDKRTPRRTIDPNEMRLQGIKEGDENSPTLSAMEKEPFPGKKGYSSLSSMSSVGSVNITLPKYSTESNSIAMHSSCSLASQRISDNKAKLNLDSFETIPLGLDTVDSESDFLPVVNARRSEMSLDSLNITRDSLESTKVSYLPETAFPAASDKKSDLHHSWSNPTHTPGGTRRESQRQVQEYLTYLESTSSCSAFSDDAASPDPNGHSKISVKDACHALLSLQIAGDDDNNSKEDSIVPACLVPSEEKLKNCSAVELRNEIPTDEDKGTKTPDTSTSVSEFGGSASTCSSSLLWHQCSHSDCTSSGSSCSYVTSSANESEEIDGSDDDEDEPLARRKLFLESTSPVSGSATRSQSKSSSFNLPSYDGQISDFVDAETIVAVSIQTVEDANAPDDFVPETCKISATDVPFDNAQSECQTSRDVPAKSPVNETPDLPGKMLSAKKGLPAYLELLKVEDITADSEVIEKDLDIIENIECEAVPQLLAKIPADSKTFETTHVAEVNTVDSSSDDGIWNETVDSRDGSSFSDSSQDEVVFHYYSNNKRTLGTCIEEEEEDEEAEEEVADVQEETAIILASLAGQTENDLCRIRNQSTLTSILLDSLEYSADSIKMNSVVAIHPPGQETEQKDAMGEIKRKGSCIDAKSPREATRTSKKMCNTPAKEQAIDISNVSDSECPTPESPKDEAIKDECTPSQPSSLTSLSHTLTGSVALCNGVHSVGLYSPRVRFGSTSSEDALCTNKLRPSSTTSTASDSSSDCIVISPEGKSNKPVDSEDAIKIIELSSDSDSECEMFEENRLDVHESLYSTVRCPRASDEISDVSNFFSMPFAGYASVKVKTEPMESLESKHMNQNEMSSGDSSDSSFEVVSENETKAGPVKEPVESESVEVSKSSARIVAELVEAAEEESFHQPKPDGVTVQARTEAEFEILGVSKTCAYFSALSIEPDPEDKDIVPEQLATLENAVVQNEKKTSLEFEAVYSNWTPIDVKEEPIDLAGEEKDVTATDGEAEKSESLRVMEATTTHPIASAASMTNVSIMNCLVDSGPHSWMDLPHDIRSITSCEIGSKWTDLGPMSSESKTLQTTDNDQQNMSDLLSVSNDSAVQSLEHISTDDAIPWNGGRLEGRTPSSFSESSQEDSGEHEDVPLQVSSPNANLEVFGAETLQSMHTSQAFPSLGALPSVAFGSPNSWFFPPQSLTSADISPERKCDPHVQIKNESCSGFFSYVAKQNEPSSPPFIKQEPEPESPAGAIVSSCEQMQPFKQCSSDKVDGLTTGISFIRSVEDDYSHGHHFKQEDDRIKREDMNRPVPILQALDMPAHITPAESSDEKHVFTSVSDVDFNTMMDIDEVEACEPEGYLSLVSRAVLLGSTDREYDAVSSSDKISSARPDGDNNVAGSGRTLEEKLRELKRLQDEKMKLKEKIENAKSPCSKQKTNIFKQPNAEPPRSAMKKTAHPVLDLTPKHLTKVTKQNTKANGLPRVRLRLQTPGHNTVVRHSPAVKAVSKIKWTEALVVEPEYHTPSKAVRTNKPILVEKPGHVFPYQDEKPSPVGFSRLARTRTLGRKSLEARYAKLLVKEEMERDAQVKAASRGRGKGARHGAKKAPPMDWSQASPKVDTGLTGRRNRGGRPGGIKMEPLDSPRQLVTPVKQEPGSMRPGSSKKK
ncbi:uncharacterized protein LOC135500777 [Lineus longissimus]|uniref:uncharacterized protein LOC135500777 n=1 Tax=Lineus longissimus TaxID=88925 RepID=UPI00315DEAE8